ncbi:MAG TPA: hypothetical protein VFQ53_23515 [Kofleriaceae bacterium]|nr:hypothetical protein [Kofleriaceae bacterium]
MPCGRCGADEVTTSGWCEDCERLHDAWSRQHAADIIWQAFSGAIIAMVVALGAPLLGLSPLLGIGGVLVGAGTFVGLRRWSTRRRRQQFLANALPRAYLPVKSS